MKKHILCAGLLLLSATLFAQNTTLQTVLPLLQAPYRSAVQNQQVVDLFVSAKQPQIVFSAGASLVRIPPAMNQENKLLNVVINNSDDLKKIFAAVILTAMGTTHPELSELLQQATASADTAVRAYAAAAYTILNPQAKQYANDVVQLYIYDPAFAQRAMNLLCSTDKQMLSYLKTAAGAAQPDLRAAAATWLGDLQSKAAAKQLLKMAKTQTDTQVMTAVAIALAKNRSNTMSSVVNGLKTNYTAPAATTYALALGFMTGYAVDPLKQNLTSKNLNVRINAARAAAYMAGVLNSDQASLYTTDKSFDTQLLKGVIPSLAVMFRTDQAAAQPYADTALKQIAKLK